MSGTKTSHYARHRLPKSFRCLYAALIFCLLAYPPAKAQTLYIQKGQKKLKILPGQHFQARLLGDTTAFSVRSGQEPYRIEKITHDSIIVSRPVEWKDTFKYEFNTWTGKFEENKKIYYKKVTRSVSEQYAIKDISTFTYTYQHDQSGDGCIACILIPGLNIYYFWSKAYHTRVFSTAEWKFAWK